MEKRIEKLLKEHTKEAIAKRLGEKPSPSYLKDIVYGSVDGIILTALSFLIVSAMKILYIQRKWLFSALETLLAGSMATSIYFLLMDSWKHRLNA